MGETYQGWRDGKLTRSGSFAIKRADPEWENKLMRWFGNNDATNGWFTNTTSHTFATGATWGYAYGPGQSVGTQIVIDGPVDVQVQRPAARQPAKPKAADPLDWLRGRVDECVALGSLA